MAIAAAEARIQAEAEQVRSTLLSSVSHDLKTPLAAIAGASSSLLEAPTSDDETRRELLQTDLGRGPTPGPACWKTSSRCRGWNREQRRPTSNGTSWRRSSAPPCIARVVNWNTIRWMSGFPPDLPLVFVDGLLLEQLFVNLLENAARYTPAGTAVTHHGRHSRASRWSSRWPTMVPDLSPGTEERIFEKFYRASPAADSGRGSGLGLAICRAVAQAHGGKITAHNRAGGGAEFVLRLPLAENAPQVVVE